MDKGRQKETEENKNTTGVLACHSATRYELTAHVLLSLEIFLLGFVFVSLK
jgi:hypothetical protein